MAGAGVLYLALAISVITDDGQMMAHNHQHGQLDYAKFGNETATKHMTNVTTLAGVPV